jgi:hypothetical protein
LRLEAKKTLPGLIALALIVGCGVFLSRPRVIYGNPTGEVPLELPAEIGGYKAEQLLFCTSDQCSRAFRESDLLLTTNGVSEVRASCPNCGSPLAPISIGEAKLLPDNTPIFRREYIREGHPAIQTTVVFSGIERRSIHRPQVCLVSQGNRITNEYPYDVKVGGGKTLRMRVLDIQQVFGNADGTQSVLSAVYAYWLFNPERETDSHLRRFLYMAIDNSFRGYRPRWGYATISFERDLRDPDAWKRQLDEFVPLLYPVLEDVRQKLNAQRNITTVIRRSSSEINTYEGKTGDVTENPHLRQDSEAAPEMKKTK